MKPNKPDRGERCVWSAAGNTDCRKSIPSQTFIYFTYLLNKYLSIDFLNPGALRSSDKETKAQGGKTTYCRSHGQSLVSLGQRAQEVHLLSYNKPAHPLKARCVPRWYAQRSLQVCQDLGQAGPVLPGMAISSRWPKRISVFLCLLRASLFVERLNRISLGCGAGQFWTQVTGNYLKKKFFFN